MKSIGNYGRFANCLFQIAGVLGIARRNGLGPVFPELVNADHRDRFHSTEDVELAKYFENPLPSIPEGVHFAKDRPVGWGYEHVDLGPGNWNLSGHFQSQRYFDHCLDEVRHYLRMKNEPAQNDLCAIHYRAGDYTEGPDSYHPRMTMDYYWPAIEKFGSSQRFRVFSDDIPGAKKMFGRYATYQEGGTYLDDFRLMKRCQHFIIANSSFSAMAAILGEASDKQVVAPSPWFGKAASITGKDIYNSDWQIINYAH